MPGEALRLIDQPVFLDGLDHIFDRLPADFKSGNFLEWRRHTFEKLVRGCRLYHGAAFEAYIKTLITRGRKQIQREIERYVAAFRARACDGFDGQEAREVAERYGLLYGGGMLGIKAGIVDWDPADLLDALLKCFRAARELLPDDGNVLRAGIRELHKQIATLPKVTSTAKSKFDKSDGYRITKNGFHRCTVRCEEFASWFSDQHQRRLVLDWLVEKRRIVLARPKVSAGTKNGTPQEQFVWADGKRRRSYTIAFPQQKVRNATASKPVGRRDCWPIDRTPASRGSTNHHCHEVGKAALDRNGRDVGRPDLVRPLDRQVAQQIRKGRVPRRRLRTRARQQYGTRGASS